MTRYAYRPLDADWIEIGDGETLLPGGGEDGEDVRLNHAFVVSHPPEIRAARGWTAIAQTDPPALPPGVGAASRHLVDVDGVPTEAWSTDHIATELLQAALVAAVNAERDARIEAGFIWDGRAFQSRQSDRENISTLGMIATLAIAAGAQPGDYRWHGGAEDFVFILADNSTAPLDAHDMRAVFQAGVAFKTALTFAGRAKKDWLLDAARIRAELLAFDPAADWPAA